MSEPETESDLMTERDELIDEINDLNRDMIKLRTELTAAESTISTQSIQLEAALAACRAFMGRYQNKIVDARLLFSDVAEKCQVALSMSPESAAGIIAERDRLRTALEEFARPKNWTLDANRVWLHPGYPVEFAKEALAPAAGKEGQG